VTAMIGTYAAGCDSENDAFLNGEGTRGHCEEPGGADPHCRSGGCGDGILDSGEVCDDGNKADGDGCNAECAVEDCYTCGGAGPGGCAVATEGTSCSGGVCNSAGTCVECLATPDCKSANLYCEMNQCRRRKDRGATCGDESECATKFCADGVCCDTACAGTCQSCNVPASPGICSYVPKYESDNDSCSPAGNGQPGGGGLQLGVCNGSGVCASDTGADCTANIDCVSGVCGNYKCKKTKGEPCASNNQCQSWSCNFSNHQCNGVQKDQPCTWNDQCQSSSCDPNTKKCL
jgi:cysteine-rich repeat protein